MALPKSGRFFLPQPQSRQRHDQKFIRTNSKTRQRVFGSSAGRIGKLFRRRGDMRRRQSKNSAGVGGLEIGGRILSQDVRRRQFRQLMTLPAQINLNRTHKRQQVKVRSILNHPTAPLGKMFGFCRRNPSLAISFSP